MLNPPNGCGNASVSLFKAMLQWLDNHGIEDSLSSKLESILALFKAHCKYAC